MKKTKIFWKTNGLAHLQPVGATFFVTFRLFGSIPRSEIQKLFENKQKLKTKIYKEKPKDYLSLLSKIEKDFFKQFDIVLDKIKAGPTYLKEPKVAQTVIDKLFEYDEKLYTLLAYTIMHNHVHLVLNTNIQVHGKVIEDEVNESNFIQLKEIVKKIKGGSAYAANKILGRTGSFWAPNYYDYMIRDDKELLRILNYVVNNPVKAGMVERWEDYSFNYWKLQD